MILLLLDSQGFLCPRRHLWNCSAVACSLTSSCTRLWRHFFSTLNCFCVLLNTQLSLYHFIYINGNPQKSIYFFCWVWCLPNRYVFSLSHTQSLHWYPVLVEDKVQPGLYPLDNPAELHKLPVTIFSEFSSLQVAPKQELYIPSRKKDNYDLIWHEEILV